jgi:hypothetical protein
VSIRDVGEEKVEHPGPFHVELRQSDDEGDVKTQIKSTRYIVWAAGEFAHPRDKHKKGGDETSRGGKISDSMFPGAELCLHNSRVQSWESLPGDDFVVIGK